MPVTRADVARLSGVSTAVVSYVLNDTSKPVSPDTRKRVLDAVKALNYRPNAAARALSKGTADAIGLLVADSRSPFFAQLIYAIDQQATERGYSLTVVSTKNSHTSFMGHVNQLAAQRVAGVIGLHAINATERDLLQALSLPAVLVNQNLPQPGVASVGVGFREGAQAAVEHLIGHAYRNIAYVGALEKPGRRETGWVDALAVAGLSESGPYLTDFSLQGGYSAGLRVAEAPDRPRALFVASDQMAIGLIAALHEASLRIPEDIAIVGFDGIMESAYLWPPLTTVKQPLDEMARATIDIILGEHDPDSAITLSPTLIVRRSCGCTERTPPHG